MSLLLLFGGGALKVKVDAAASGSGVLGSTLSWSHTVASQSNRCLVVGVSVLDALGQTVSGITFGGVALTYIGAISNGTANRVELWSLTAPAVSTATVTVTFSTSATAVGGSVSLYNVDQTDPLGEFVVSSGTGTSASVTAPVDSVNDMVLDTVATAATSLTVGGGQTQQWNVALTGIGGAGSTETPSGSSVTMSWTNGLSAAWSQIALDVHVVGQTAIDRDVLGVVANLTLAAPAGSLAVGSTVTGAVAALTLAAPAGSIGAGVTLNGAVAALTLAAPAGAAYADAPVSGAVANLTLAAPAGGVESQPPAILGLVANMTLAAPAGVVTVGSIISAAPANMTLAAPPGAATGGAIVAGITAALTLAAPAGQVGGGANVNGAVAALSLAAPAGAVRVDVALVGVVANMTFAAPAGVLVVTPPYLMTPLHAVLIPVTPTRVVLSPLTPSRCTLEPQAPTRSH